MSTDIGSAAYVAEASFNAAISATGGSNLVGANDGASGSLFTTVQGFVTKLLSSAGAATVGFSHDQAYTRPSVGAKLKTMVNVYDYPFNCTGDGSADDTVKFQQAMNFVASSPISRSLYVPEGRFKTTSTLNSTLPIRIIGEGCAPYRGNNGAPGTEGPGSWLMLDHLNTGINFGDGTIISGVEIEGIGFQRPMQPTPGSSAWAPLDNGYDIALDSADAILRDLMFLGTSRGIQAYNGNYGRLTAENIFGHFFIEGMNLDKQYDLCMVSNFRSWPYWSGNANVTTYTLENLSSIILGRVDNPQFNNLFSISHKGGIVITQTADDGAYPGGTVSKGKFSNIDMDNGKYGIVVDGSVTDTAVLDFVNLSIQAPAGEAASNGIFLEGSNTKIGIVNGDFRGFQQNAVRCDGGTGNRLELSGRILVDGFNQVGAGFPAFELSAGNSMHLWALPEIDNGVAGAATYGGGGTFTIPTTATP